MIKRNKLINVIIDLIGKARLDFRRDTPDLTFALKYYRAHLFN